jgi:hypothetical protein
MKHLDYIPNRLPYYTRESFDSLPRINPLFTPPTPAGSYKGIPSITRSYPPYQADSPESNPSPPITSEPLPGQPTIPPVEQLPIKPPQTTSPPTTEPPQPIQPTPPPNSAPPTFTLGAPTIQPKPSISYQPPASTQPGYIPPYAQPGFTPPGQPYKPIPSVTQQKPPMTYSELMALQQSNLAAEKPNNPIQQHGLGQKDPTIGTGVDPRNLQHQLLVQYGIKVPLAALLTLLTGNAPESWNVASLAYQLLSQQGGSEYLHPQEDVSGLPPAPIDQPAEPGENNQWTIVPF